jgi:hypothetical protein
MLALCSGPLPPFRSTTTPGWFGAVFVFMLVYLLFASRYTEQPRKDLMENWIAFLEPAGILLCTHRARHHHHAAGRRRSDPYASPANYVGTDQALA